MTSTSTEQAPYLADFDAFQRRVGADDPSWLRDLRRRAIDRFEEVGFPTARRGNEPWKYTSVAPIARASFRYAFETSALPAGTVRRLALGRDWTLLVFVDGHYQPELSATEGLADGVRVANLAQAASGNAEAAATHFGRIARLNGDGFTALSTAFAHDGAFVSLAPGAAAGHPIHVLHIATGAAEGAVAYPRTLILAGQGSAATVVESFVGLSGASSFTNAVTEVAVGEGARLEHYKLMLEGAGAYHVATTQVSQSRDSAFTSTSVAAGGRMARNNVNVLLDGPGSEATLNGLYLTSGSQHVDNATFVDHATPHTTSHQLYKGILDGESRAVFSGRVLVRRGAQKTDAHQTNKNLILSRGAEADTKPFLEIFADDVKCTHGATAGKLDEESLFYLRSRGLDAERARELLAFGFAVEVMNRIALIPVRHQVEKLLLRSLPSLHPGTSAPGAPS